MATHYVALPQSPPSTLVGLNEMETSFNIANTSGGAGFVINDTVDFFELPPGSVLEDFSLDLPILDSNVSPACVLSLGTDISAANGGLGPTGILSNSTAGSHFSAATVLSKVGNVSGYQQGSLPFYYQAKLFGPGGNVQQQWAKFRLTITTAPATTATTGIMWATIRYRMTGDAGTFGLKNL